MKNNSEDFSLLLTNTNKMKKLNLKFRKQNTTTDVLSFSFSENQKLISGANFKFDERGIVNNNMFIFGVRQVYEFNSTYQFYDENLLQKYL